MTVFSRTWNPTYEATPGSGALASEGDDRIRDLKADIRERTEVDHSWDGDVDDGEHKKVSFTEPLSSDPTNAANKGHLYTKDVTAKAELFWQDEDGNAVQLTAAGAIKIADNAIDLAQLAHATSGDILYFGASGVPFRLAKGSDGEFLTLVSGIPAWGTVTVPTAASQAEMETGTDTAKFVTPGRQHHHPAHPKAWVTFDAASVTGTNDLTGVGASYNITGVVDNGTGDYTVNWATDFSGVEYCVVATALVAPGGATVIHADTGSQAAGSIDIRAQSTAGGIADPDTVFVAALGDHS